jgi:hypothetical protein
MKSLHRLIALFQPTTRPPPVEPGSRRETRTLAIRLAGGLLCALVLLAFPAQPAPADVFIVTTTADALEPGDGSLSLRGAITAANAAPGPHTILFDIGGSPPYTIQVGPVALPHIAVPVIIDGTTQPGYDPVTGTPLVVLDGATVTEPVLVQGPIPVEYKDGLHLTADGCTIRGLTIQNFPETGINLYSSYHLLEKNQVAGNAHAGIQGSVSLGTVVLGNSITGNGINSVSGGGILMLAKGYLGGPATIADNDITDNFGFGVQIYQESSVIRHNLVSRNTGPGVWVFGNYTEILFNRIGTRPDGTGGAGDWGNGENGLIVAGLAEDREFVGIKNIVRGNVIVANSQNGVFLPSARLSTLAGNRIGVDVDDKSFPNAGHGILLAGNASGNVIGGFAFSRQGNLEANTIWYNQGAGVFVSSGVGNTIRGNSTYANGGLGIDLGPAGVNPILPAGSGTGPNKLLNYPVLVSAKAAANGPPQPNTIWLSLYNSGNPKKLTLDFYLSDSGDRSGHGEGQIYVGTVQVTAPPTAVSLPVNVPFSVPAGVTKYLTATATDAEGNTSEFSNWVPISSAGGPPVRTR